MSDQDKAPQPASAQDELEKWPSEGLIGAVAQGWCSEANEGKDMDSDLAFDIATSVHRYLQSRQQPPTPSALHANDLTDAADLLQACGQKGGIVDVLRNAAAQLAINAGETKKTDLDDLRDMLRVEVDRLIAAQTAVAMPDVPRMYHGFEVAKMARDHGATVSGENLGLSDRYTFTSTQLASLVNAALAVQPKETP